MRSYDLMPKDLGNRFMLFPPMPSISMLHPALEAYSDNLGSRAILAYYATLSSLVLPGAYDCPCAIPTCTPIIIRTVPSTCIHSPTPPLGTGSKLVDQEPSTKKGDL